MLYPPKVNFSVSKKIIAGLTLPMNIIEAGYFVKQKTRKFFLLTRFDGLTYI